MEGKNEGEGGGKGEFPGGPVVKMLLLPMYGAWVQSLVRELRSYIPHGKKKKGRSWGEKGGEGKTEGKQEGRGIRLLITVLSSILG